MKLRNVLMTAAFVLAVTSTFAIKAKGKTYGYLSYVLGGRCNVSHSLPSQVDCHESYTGPQCTYIGVPAWAYDVTGFPPPTCTIPLRQP